MELSFFFVERQQEAAALKKTIPGASWDGSRFLSRSATATCCELSMLNLLPLGKQKQAFGKNLIYNWIRRTSTMFLIPSTVTDNTAKIISQR